MTKMLAKNPFQITTPEDLTAEETVSLFVDVFTDFQKIIDPGHVFLIGPRGTGKSMMFRYLQPDCQCLAKQCTLADLPFLGVYVPLKDTNFSLAELKRLEQRHASDILSEHILVTHFCVKIFRALAKPELYPVNEDSTTALKEFFHEVFLPTFQAFSTKEYKDSLDDTHSAAETFEKMAKLSESMYIEAFTFAKRLAFRTNLIPYDGPLCDYPGFLLPILSALPKIQGFPEGPLYLLVDDAHWLTKTQARVLNSWVATRTSRRVSFKVSTQYNYSTYYTVSGATIDTPHDFTEIDISTIYTGSRKSKYKERIATIVQKRLDTAGIEGISAEQFFPFDVKQEAEIETIKTDYNKRHDSGKGKGHYRNDDAIRYARPDYIKELAGSRKSSSKYSYSGFEQLVHLSSGILRHFIEPAHLMYAETIAGSSGKTVTMISPTVQDTIVRNEANNFLFSDIERISLEGHPEAPPEEDILKLKNLIHGLGGVFRQILLTPGRSERRVFSIAFSDSPSEMVRYILNLGVQLGYFHKSTIGKKDSKSGGRTRLYVLNRRLAPIWTLDPTGFAGYLFVTNSLVEDAIMKPESMLRRLDKDGIPDGTEIVQLEMF